MSSEVVGHACILSDLVSSFSLVFFGANIVGVRILVACWLCFLDDLAGTWYGLVIYFGTGY
jgi:hypothetical protein